MEKNVQATKNTQPRPGFVISENEVCFKKTDALDQRTEDEPTVPTS
jgi:hypothetical protein